MISLRGLADHTLKSYCTYIRSYLDYLSNILHKQPEDVSWNELRDYIRWLQKERNLSDRTINCAISQLRFFTIYVLHKSWDNSQLPMRKFNTYLPFVPSQKETWHFISTMPDIKQKTMVAVMYSSGLRIGEVCHLRYEDIDRTNMRIHISHGKTGKIGMPPCQGLLWIFLHNTGLNVADPGGGCFLSNMTRSVLLTPSFCTGTYVHTKSVLDGQNVSPAILSGMLMVHIFTKTAQIF